MSINDGDIVSDFSDDMTMRWSCREGDYILWFTLPSLLTPKIAIADIWEMKDGDFVTITNRVADMPEWFSFHPTEVRGSLVYRLLDRFNNHEYPDEPITGPNIWRPKSGDRFVWLRSNAKGESGSILAVIAFDECALAIGDNVRPLSMNQLISFGSLTKSQQREDEIEMAREAFAFVKQMGMPGVYSPEWKIG